MSDDTPSPEAKSFVSTSTWAVTNDRIDVDWLADQDRHCAWIGWDVRLYLTAADALKLYHKLGESLMCRNQLESK